MGVLHVYGTFPLMRNRTPGRGWGYHARPNIFAVFYAGFRVAPTTDPTLCHDLKKPQSFFRIFEFFATIVGQYRMKVASSLATKLPPVRNK